MVDLGLSSEVIRFIDESDKYEGIRIEENNATDSLNNKEVSYVIMANKSINSEGIKIYALKNDEGLLEIQGILESVLKGEIINEPQNPVDEGRMVLGFSTMFILMFMGAITGNILEDRREKTLMRVYASPLGRIKISFGYLTAFLILGLLQVTTYITITKYIMKNILELLTEI